MASEQFFSARVEQKTTGIMVCALHLEQFLVAGTKYLCTSNAEVNFWFEGLDKKILEIVFKILFEKNGRNLLM